MHRGGPRRAPAMVLLQRLASRLRLIPVMLLLRLPAWPVSVRLAEAEDRSRVVSHCLKVLGEGEGARAEVGETRRRRE